MASSAPFAPFGPKTDKGVMKGLKSINLFLDTSNLVNRACPSVIRRYIAPFQRTAPWRTYRVPGRYPVLF